MEKSQGKCKVSAADLESADFVCIDPSVLLYNLKEYEEPSKLQKLYPIHPMMVSDEKMKQVIRNFVRLQMYRRAMIARRDILWPSKAKAKAAAAASKSGGSSSKVNNKE